MSYREVPVYEIREVLRLWLRGEGMRSIERLAGVDRKTVRRYLSAACESGFVRDGDEAQLSDELISRICEAVRPRRTSGHVESWDKLVANHEQLKTWLIEEKLTVVKAKELLERRGVVVPERTMHRYVLQVLGVGRHTRKTTVRGRRRRAGGRAAGRLRQDGPHRRPR
jgi:hypothetical protein